MKTYVCLALSLMMLGFANTALADGSNSDSNSNEIIHMPALIITARPPKVLVCGGANPLEQGSGTVRRCEWVSTAK